MSRLIRYLSAFGSFNYIPAVHVRDPLEGIDVEKEYELIKQKKSKLSAKMRRLVSARVENAKRLGRCKND